VTQDLHEEAARAQIGAEVIVDAVTVLADQPDGAGAHAFELRMDLKDVEDLEKGDRVALKHARRGHLEIAAA
jgi:hypothetical protein